MPTNLAPSWPSTVLPDSSSSVYGRSVWPGGPRRDEASIGLTLGAPGGNADRSGMRMEVAAPTLEQAFPPASGALPAFPPRPSPSPNWPQVPGPHSQPIFFWDHPVHIARQHTGHNSSIGFLPTRPGNPPFQLATSSVTVGRSERIFMQTSPFPLIASPDSVQPLPLSDAVPVACTFLFAVVNSFFFEIITHASYSIPISRRTVGSLERDHVSMSVDKPVCGTCRWK